MKLIEPRKAIHHTFEVFKTEFKTFAKILWPYLLLSCLLTLSENYLYAFLPENRLWEYYLDDYRYYVFVFCPVAKALLIAVGFVGVCRHLILGPQPSTANVVLRRDLLTDRSVISLPVYLPISWGVPAVALFVIFWEYSLSEIRHVFPFTVFPARNDVILRMLFEIVCLIPYSFILTRLVLVFPYITVSKKVSAREATEHISCLKGNHVRIWAVLMYFSIMYSAIRGLLKGPFARSISLDFYHAEFFVNLRYITVVVIWFCYITLMAIFSAEAFKSLSKPSSPKAHKKR
jgi:hypothetical protein